MTACLIYFSTLHVECNKVPDGRTDRQTKWRLYAFGGA